MKQSIKEKMVIQHFKICYYYLFFSCLKKHMCIFQGNGFYLKDYKTIYVYKRNLKKKLKKKET